MFQKLRSWILSQPALAMTLAMGLCLVILQPRLYGFGVGHHGYLSGHGMTLVGNLKLQTPFFMYESRAEDKDGKIIYDPYNRFPSTAFWLIKAVNAPFSGNTKAEIYSARALMGLFHAATLVLIFLFFQMLLKNPCWALIGTTLSASNFFMIYYRDMIFNDVPTLTVFLLLTWAILGSWSRKWIYTLVLVGVSLSWQVLCVLGAWVLWEASQKNLRLVRDINIFRWESVKLTFFGVFIASIHFGLSMYSEAIVTGQKFMELDSMRSILFRLGLDPEGYSKYQDAVGWTYYVSELSLRWSKLLLPSVVVSAIPNSVWSVVKFVLPALGLIWVSRFIFKNKSSFESRVLFMLCVPGLIWYLGMRHFVAFHDFQTLYHIGFAVSFWYLALRFISGLSFFRTDIGKYTTLGFCILTLILAVLATDRGKRSTARALWTESTEFQRIRNLLTPETRIKVHGNRTELGTGIHTAHYFLRDFIFSHNEEVEYLISRKNDLNYSLLTPDHSKLFLYKIREDSK